MRFNAFIAVCAICLASEAALRFTRPVWRADLNLSIPCLEGAEGEPLDMPRAEAYLVTRDGESFLEDRFDSFDLWTCRTLRARWRDADGNRLYVAKLDSVPIGDSPGTTRTRRSFAAELEKQTFNPKDPAQRDEAAAAVSPVDLVRAVKPRRAQRRNIAELVSYITTNDLAIVTAFRPKDPEKKGPGNWYLAALVAAPESDMAEMRALFDEDFLDRISVPRSVAGGQSAAGGRESSVTGGKSSMDDDRSAKERSESPTTIEAGLLRADVRAQVVNYDEWESTDSEDVTVLDNLDAALRTGFVTAMTNTLPRLRHEYALRIPSPLSLTNALAVVRVFKNREQYLAYAGVDKKWTDALWSPMHRELVMYHPEQGMEKLLRTVWHESFHQYLAYAGSMIESSPWFNEGHSQLFENSHFDGKGNLIFERDAEAAAYVNEYASALAEILPVVFEMDYTEFYAGTQEEVAAKYRLVWSVAYFLETGAPKLRFQPYASLRADYMKTLVETRSMKKATHAVFGDEKKRDAFIAAWLAFWTR